MINSWILKIILDYWGGPNGIKRFLLRGRLEGQRQNRKCDEGSRVRRERDKEGETEIGRGFAVSFKIKEDSHESRNTGSL